MAALLASGFDWDAGNREKCLKHEVDCRDRGGLGRRSANRSSSKTIIYWKAIYCRRPDTRRRPLFIAFTLRARDGARLVRPISARYMHAKEIEPI
jgi:uncharacterized DUF497 family protein